MESRFCRLVGNLHYASIYYTGQNNGSKILAARLVSSLKNMGEGMTKVGRCRSETDSSICCSIFNENLRGLGSREEKEESDLL